MRLFNLDAHISVIADVENIFTHLYPEVEITKWSVSGHTWVFDEQKDPVEIVNHKTWKQLDLKMIQQFQQRYDNFLRLFDGFICGFPPVFSLLFEKYNKPIFMINATRYEMPFCWQKNDEMQDYFESRLHAMHQRGQLIAVSNNKADYEYLKRATDIESTVIPSMCRYTKASYTGSKEDFVLFSKARLNPVEGLINYRDLGKYSWQELYSYKGIVHLPYEISTMSIFEHYSASVPLIMPTKRLLKDFWQRKRIPYNGPYAHDNYIASGRSDMDDVLGNDWYDFWLDRADFYDQDNMPYINYYDHVSEISTLMNDLDTEMIHQQMQAHNRRRFSSALQQWQQLLSPHICPPHAKQVSSVGQINMHSKFGKIIHSIAGIKSFNTFFEVGTWNGEGSTACFMNALIRRNDNSKLYSLELMPEMYNKAKQFWSWLPQSRYAHQLKLLNGKVIGKGMMTADKIQSHPAFPKIKQHFNLYYQSDVDFFNNAQNVADQLPDIIDVVLLDGGEFCSYAEFEYVRDHLNPKVIILDDTNIIKCSMAREELLSSKHWHAYYDDLNDRHGAAVFVHSDWIDDMPILK